MRKSKPIDQRSTEADMRHSALMGIGLHVQTFKTTRMDQKRWNETK